jgi:hypothetical protein
MNQLKKALATAGTSAILAMSAGGVAAAGVNCTTTNSGVNGAQIQTCVDDSTNVAYTVSGNCSGIFRTDSDQSQRSNTEQENESAGGLVGSNNSTNSNSSSTSQSQSANGVTFAPNCSVNNVSQVAAAPAAASSSQVVAPSGGVHAGGGAGVSSASSTASVAGLVASAGSLGLGVIVRKKALLGL